jgi:elongation factor P--beta-lysine ligase
VASATLRIDLRFVSRMSFVMVCSGVVVGFDQLLVDHSS